MSRILVTIILMAIIFGYPQFSQGTDGPCGALVGVVTKSVVPLRTGDNPLVKGMTSALGGSVGYKMAAERYIGIPPQLTCTYLFWRATVDPTSISDATKALGTVPAQ